jgi:glycosyltransferase involved in cell wall biosynthesis
VQAVFEHVMAACEGRLQPTAPAAEAATVGTQDRVGRLVDGLADLLSEGWSPTEMARVAACVSANHRLLVQRKQLLVDVSELVKSDARSGIQRVVRAILLQLLREPPDGHVVEPVYARSGEPGYRYARAFKQRFLGKAPGSVVDDPVETWTGDIFLGLDLNPTLVVEQEPQLQDWRKRGVRVLLVIYDLLPLLLPKTFDAPLAMAYAQWLNTVARLDGAIAISRTVAEELLVWLDLYGPPRLRKLPVGWFHLGSALGESAPSLGVPPSAPALLAQLASEPTLLMVGTLEPRKAHGEVLAACELLWARGVRVNLVVVGKAGWLLGDLVSRLRRHKEAGRQLHWLEGISDEYLEQVYARSTALVAASWGEGFGLPLVEGAAHGLALIARDIPVFREVAGEAAYYFPRKCTAGQLADCLAQWLELHAQGLHPKSEALRALNWAESTTQLMRCVVHQTWPLAWQAQSAQRFSGADNRMHTTPVGQREGMSIRSTGAAGNLVFGPYLTLRAGHHRMRMWGQVEAEGGHARFDVVHDSGRAELISGPIAITATGGWSVERQLVLAQEVPGVEFRVWVDAGTLVIFDGLEIAPISDIDEGAVSSASVKESNAAIVPPPSGNRLHAPSV